MENMFRKRFLSGVCAFVALVAAADTLEVAEDATVRLESGVDYSATTVALQGGTLDQNGVTAAFAGMTVANNSTNHLANTGDASAVATIPGKLETSYASAIYISSGKWTGCPVWIIGKWGNECILDISGVDTELTAERTSDWYFSDNAPATINFRGGRTTFKNDRGVYLASGVTGHCVWNVSGGTHEFSDVLKFYRGTVEINLSNGTLKPQYIRMGMADNADAHTHTINQTGGVLEVPREFCLMHSTGSGCNTFVNLDGGLTWAPKLYANVSTRGATSTLTADGGTLRPNMSSSEFITGIDNFLLGEQGLTLHIGSYPTTVPQAITGVKEGAAFGRLAKKGGATLKLTGAIADGIKVVNEEAALEVNGSIGAGEICASAGVVTINGTVGAKARLTVDGGEIAISPDATVDPSVNVGVENGVLRVQKDVTVRTCEVGALGRIVYENGAKLTVSNPGLVIIFR